MCGIFGYIGDKEAYPLIIKGLKRLEYRGYDSAGIALSGAGGLLVYKKKGKVSELEGFASGKNVAGRSGIGHTRWATHGLPNDTNAHPHVSMSGKVTLVHNGIIENYLTIKKDLESKGYIFTSETDTEVLVNLIDSIYFNTGENIEEAVRFALQNVVGAYAIVVLLKDDPSKMIIARKGSPVVIGIGDGEYFVASDASPIVEYTKQVTYLNDSEIAVISDGGLVVKNINNEIINPYIEKLDLDLEMIEKGGFPHFMLKEIFEQPRTIYESIRGRLNTKEGFVNLGGLGEYQDALSGAKRIIVVACGTSWHAGLTAKYYFEELARIPTSVEYASEFRYMNPVIGPGDLVVAISQSGETADTLAAINLAKEKGATVFGVCNVVGSSISRATHAGTYTHAGPEIGVASTKAFTSQIAVLLLWALFAGSIKGVISKEKFQEIALELENISEKVEKALADSSSIEEIAREFKDARNFIYLGRGYGFPLALEGALKLKEISYIHAEGYPAAEMKHGPIALIDEHMPVVCIVNKGTSYEKVMSNIMEVRSRKGMIIAIATEGDEEIQKIADRTIFIPKTSDVLMPFVASIPLQFLSYHIAVLRGCDVDKPRNLAKSVTVE